MKVRHKETGVLGYASRWNPAAISPAEIIVWFEDGSASSEYLREWEPIEGTIDHLRAYLDSKEP